MRGILIDSGKPPEIRNVPDTAQGLDAYLGGPVRVKLFSTQPAARSPGVSSGASRPGPAHPLL